MSKKFSIPILIFFIVLILLFASSKLIVEIEWFKEVNYIEVFFTKVIAISKLFIPILVIYFLILWLYTNSLIKSLSTIIDVNKTLKIKKITIIVTLIIASILAYGTSTNQWYKILQFGNSVYFNHNDPIFNLDVSFYIFKLPLLQSLYKSLISLIIAMVLITLITYFILKAKHKLTEVTNININSNRNILNSSGKQLAILVALFMIMVSIGYILRGFTLVYSKRGVAYGASYTDVNVTLLFYRVISIAALIVGAVVFFSIKKSKIKPIIIGAISIICLIILEPITAGFVQQFIVKSNEMDFEKKYIGYNIEATRKAFNIDSIKEKDYEPDLNINLTQLNNNKDIIDNIKVNSAEPTLNFYNQVQLLKNYYEFSDIDTDRYKINNKYTQVFLAPREINSSSMGTWQNQHLRYTHGYGLAMNKVNSVTSEGQPDFLMQDIPTVNKTDLKLDNPRMYFGEGQNNYVIVNTDIEEFDYPSGDKENNFKYNGNSGIKMNMFNRILFSIQEGNPRILFSGAINSDSKIILNRNIMERVKTIAPFLEYDKDPYAVIHDGRIVWVIDAYTTSNKYPFSEAYNGINYMRNSIKITVDAYNGDTNFYIIDKNDPIAVSYQKIFKGLFKDGDSIPKDIREHFRYPQDIFKTQSEVISKYHVKNTTEFFTQEDLWDISSNIENVEGKERVEESLYLMTRLPEEKQLEMVLFQYFNMKGKQNMVSVLGARMDGDNYGKLMLYKFPPQKNIYSPYSFKNRILQDPDISKDISLWQGKGSKVVYGDIIIVPIEKSLLYLDTIYLKADTEQSMPEMKRVIVSNGDKIVSEGTVEKALEKLFNYKEDKNNIEDKTSDKINNNNVIDAKKAKEFYEKAIDAQKQGDWQKYGEYIKSLGELIDKANKQ
ncbi:UPF0182 family protein [Clostridium cavendishii]|nr:UPF0182 family protein [Clostridium cavendishii]